MYAEITVPAWAAKIRVQRFPTKLVVTGNDRVEDLAVLRSELSPSQDLLGQYVPVIEWGQKHESPPPHLRFAMAETRGDQLAFVRRYGPIWGRVVQTSPDLIVEQGISSLHRQQIIFGLVAKLIAAVRQPRTDRSQIEELSYRLLGKGGYAPGWGSDAIEARQLQRDAIDYDSPEGAEHFFVYHAHFMIGNFLNRFPPSIVFFAGRPAELPTHTYRGILPMLCFMLRRDYLSIRRSITACANGKCNRLFPTQRNGQKFCCTACSRLQRGRDYWSRAGKKLRLQRRQRQLQ